MEQSESKDNYLKSVLSKYLKGEASEAEKKAIDMWFNSFEADYGGLENEQSRQWIIKVLDGVNPQTPNAPHSHYNILKFPYRFAAAAVILLVGTLSLWHFLRHAPVEDKFSKVITSTEQLKAVTLPDGSVVELNRHSRLVITSNFNEYDRKVSLEGEAFFTVAKNAKKPFIITSGVLQTVVKGTSFDIRAYRNMGHIKVSVATGVVRVMKVKGNASPEILTDGITQNQTLTYSLAKSRGAIKNESTPDISSWRDNEIFIDNFTITEIASLLERHFNKKVVVKPGISLTEHYTMKMANPSLSHSLVTLHTLTKHQFIVRQNQIIIENKHE